MITNAVSIWYWSLPILPVTNIIILVATIATHYLIPKDHLSKSSVDPRRVIFTVAVCMSVPQILAIIIGRFQFLLKNQAIIDRIVLYIIHSIPLIPVVWTLIVVFQSGYFYHVIYLNAACGVFGPICLYCFLHTGIMFYLYLRRSITSQHSNIVWPVWFLICNVSFIVLCVVHIQTSSDITGIIILTSPFLYLLSFTPQFWLQARARQRYSIVFEAIENV